MDEGQSVLDPESGRLLGVKLTEVQKQHEQVYYDAKQVNALLRKLQLPQGVLLRQCYAQYMPVDQAAEVRRLADKLQHDTA